MIYTNHPREVACVETPLTFADATAAISSAYALVFARPIAVPALCCLLAQSALESGNWQTLRGYNFGNKKASSSYPGMHQYYPPGAVNERIGPTRELVWFDPPHPQTRFRAFATAHDGAVDYVRFLGVDTNGGGNYYQPAWDAAMRGDAKAFAVELGRLGYYSADPAKYVPSVAKIAERFNRDLAGWSAPPPPPDDDRSAFSDADWDALRARTRHAQSDVTDRAIRGTLWGDGDD